MSEKWKSIQSLIESLSQCPRCQQGHSEMQQLPCGHHLCRNCVQEACGETSSVDCMYCNAPLQKHFESSIELKPSLAHQHIRSYVSKAQKRHQHSCIGCYGSAEYICRSSCGMLCQVCYERHKSFKAATSHDVVSIRALQESQLIMQLSKCTKHTEETLLWICSCCTPNQFFCAQCIAEEKDSEEKHICNKATDKIDDLISQVDEKIYRASAVLEELKQTVYPIEKQIKAIEEVFQEKIKDIEAQFQKFRRKLDDLQDRVMTQARKAYSDALCGAKSEMRDFNTLRSRVMKAMNDCYEAYELYVETHSPIMLPLALHGLDSALESSNTSTLGDCPRLCIRINLPETAVLDLSQPTDSRFIEWLTIDSESVICRELCTILDPVNRINLPPPAHSGSDLSNPCSLPYGIAADPLQPRILVSDHAAHCLHILTDKLEHITTIGRFGNGQIEFNSPHAVAVSLDGLIAVADVGNGRVQILDSSFRFLNSIALRNSASNTFIQPRALAFDSYGHLFIACTGSNPIQKWSAKGEFLTSFGSGLEGIEGITVNQANEILTVSHGARKVDFFANDGSWIRKVFIHSIRDFAAICSGADNEIVVSDFDGNHIFIYSRDGVLLKQLSLDSPTGVTFSKSGDFYVCLYDKGEVLSF